MPVWGRSIVNEFACGKLSLSPLVVLHLLRYPKLLEKAQSEIVTAIKQTHPDSVYIWQGWARTIVQCTQLKSSTAWFRSHPDAKRRLFKVVLEMLAVPVENSNRLDLLLREVNQEELIDVLDWHALAGDKMDKLALTKVRLYPQVYAWDEAWKMMTPENAYVWFLWQSWQALVDQRWTDWMCMQQRYNEVFWRALTAHSSTWERLLFEVKTFESFGGSLATLPADIFPPDLNKAVYGWLISMLQGQFTHSAAVAAWKFAEIDNDILLVRWLLESGYTPDFKTLTKWHQYVPEWSETLPDTTYWQAGRFLCAKYGLLNEVLLPGVLRNVAKVIHGAYWAAVRAGVVSINKAQEKHRSGLGSAESSVKPVLDRWSGVNELGN